ncbi:probable glutathione S-transferase [Triticum dicoccoides]|uniref:probable glutathione S-transferase n=1 Tax=Triticum dicoccoides TaxID=85692 RepID=UPI00188FA0EB|nr:probable glutathione S-transferase [Triticum dicoccoides]
MGEPVKVMSTFGSIYGHRPEVALRLKGIPYELLLEDLPNNKSELLLTCNPVHKLVPVLLHGHRSICESLIIVEYIDEAFKGPPLLPADPYERATARFWAQFIDQKFARPFWMSICMADGDKEEEEDFLKVAKENLLLLEGQLKGKRFFGGDSIGLVDIAASGLARWLEAFEEISGVDLLTNEEFPVLHRWAKAYAGDERAKECLPNMDELVSKFTAVRKKFQAMAEVPK